MLNRDTICMTEISTLKQALKLSQTLTGFLPHDWKLRIRPRSRILPLGYHLIWFNQDVPTEQLLPDGTDAIHSPGEPWVRRMWAGGSMRINTETYYDEKDGFVVNSPIIRAERIKDVELRGQGDAAKIFVTIERRFARMDLLQENHRAAEPGLQKPTVQSAKEYFIKQLFDDTKLGDAICTEERTLVFLKKKSEEEIAAMRANNMAKIRYLARESGQSLSQKASNCFSFGIS